MKLQFLLPFLFVQAAKAEWELPFTFKLVQPFFYSMISYDDIVHCSVDFLTIFGGYHVLRHEKFDPNSNTTDLRLRPRVMQWLPKMKRQDFMRNLPQSRPPDPNTPGFLAVTRKEANAGLEAKIISVS